jgi:hypothetical protein
MRKCVYGAVAWQWSCIVVTHLSDKVFIAPLPSYARYNILTKCYSLVSVTNWAVWQNLNVVCCILVSHSGDYEVVFSDIMLHGQVEVNRRFRGTSDLHFEGSKSKPSEISGRIRRQEEGVLCFLPPSCWFHARLTFRPSKWGNMFLRNVSRLLPVYTALHIRR